MLFELHFLLFHYYYYYYFISYMLDKLYCIPIQQDSIVLQSEPEKHDMVDGKRHVVLPITYVNENEGATEPLASIHLPAADANIKTANNDMPLENMNDGETEQNKDESVAQTGEVSAPPASVSAASASIFEKLQEKENEDDELTVGSTKNDYYSKDKLTAPCATCNQPVSPDCFCVECKQSLHRFCGFCYLKKEKEVIEIGAESDEDRRCRSCVDLQAKSIVTENVVDIQELVDENDLNPLPKSKHVDVQDIQELDDENDLNPLSKPKHVDVQDIQELVDENDPLSKPKHVDVQPRNLFVGMDLFEAIRKNVVKPPANYHHGNNLMNNSKASNLNSLVPNTREFFFVENVGGSSSLKVVPHNREPVFQSAIVKKKVKNGDFPDPRPFLTIDNFALQGFGDCSTFSIKCCLIAMVAKVRVFEKCHDDNIPRGICAGKDLEGCRGGDIRWLNCRTLVYVGSVFVVQKDDNQPHPFTFLLPVAELVINEDGGVEVTGRSFLVSYLSVMTHENENECLDLPISSKFSLTEAKQILAINSCIDMLTGVKNDKTVFFILFSATSKEIERKPFELTAIRGRPKYERPKRIEKLTVNIPGIPIVTESTVKKRVRSSSQKLTKPSYVDAPIDDNDNDGPLASAPNDDDDYKGVRTRAQRKGGRSQSGQASVSDSLNSSEHINDNNSLISAFAEYSKSCLPQPNDQKEQAIFLAAELKHERIENQKLHILMQEKTENMHAEQVAVLKEALKNQFAFGESALKSCNNSWETQVAKSNEFTLKSHQQIFNFASSSTSSHADKNVDVFATSTKSVGSTIEDKLNNIDNEIDELTKSLGSCRPSMKKITQIKIDNLKLESDELIQQYAKSELRKSTNY